MPVLLNKIHLSCVIEILNLKILFSLLNECKYVKKKKKKKNVNCKIKFYILVWGDIDSIQGNTRSQCNLVDLRKSCFEQKCAVKGVVEEPTRSLGRNSIATRGLEVEVQLNNSLSWIELAYLKRKIKSLFKIHFKL